jgi:poly-gamma-glutamate synthesis protein (capsule biosynthesis protein)
MSVLAAIILGAGSLWAVTQGLQIAFGHNPPAKDYKIQIVNNSSSAINAASINATNTLIQVPSPSATVLIGGDIMLDRKIRSIAQKKGYDYLFTSLSPLFKTADIVVANLEGPVTTNPSKTLLPSGKLTQDLTFTFVPSSVKALSNAGITAVSLANNHEDNFGAVGVTETKQWLEKSEIQWFGSPWNSPSTEFTIVKNGMKIAFVGYHAFQGGIDRVIDDVKRLTSQGNFVIVMPHWGPEYETHSTVKMRAEAKAFVAAGAKAVVGSHPHVIMENETIGGVPIYYSIGNLLFDQYFSDAVLNGEIISLKLVNGPAGPSIDSVMVYGTRLDRIKGVVLK